MVLFKLHIRLYMNVKSSRNILILSVLNSKISKLFDFREFEDNYKFININYKHFWNLGSQMQRIENKENPDVVFTVFGPAYWRPKAKHIIGFANPYYYCMKGAFRKKQNVVETIILMLKKKIHTYYMNRDCDALITETEYVTQKYLEIFYHISKGYTVSNTCNNFYQTFAQENSLYI